MRTDTRIPGVPAVLTADERDATCDLCGAAFRQTQLTPSFRAIASVAREIPDGWVPLYCPPCEHKALGCRETRFPSARKVWQPNYEPPGAYEQDEREAMRL